MNTAKKTPIASVGYSHDGSYLPKNNRGSTATVLDERLLIAKSNIYSLTSGKLILPSSENPSTALQAASIKQEDIINNAEVKSTSVNSIKDMVGTIQSVFNFNTNKLAAILGIARPTLYTHLKNDPPKDLSAYNKLYQTALKVHDQIPISISQHLRNVLVDGKTLLQYFESDWTEESILSVCKLICEKMQNAKITVPSNPRSPLHDQANLHRHVPLS